MTKRLFLILLACSSVLLAGCSTYTSQYTKVSCSNEEVFIVDGQVSYIDGYDVVVSGSIGHSCACDGEPCNCPYYTTGLYNFHAKNCDVETNSPEALIDFNNRKMLRK